MKTFIITVLSITLMFLSTSAISDQPAGSVYLDGGDSEKAVILCHGRGKDPKIEGGRSTSKRG